LTQHVIKEEFIIIIIIIIIIISFMQGIHTYIPETNHVSRIHSVAAILRVLLMVRITLSSILNSFVLLLLLLLLLLLIIIIIIPVPNRNLRVFKSFYFYLNRCNCPSARCTSAANAICRDSCIFNCRSVTINVLLPGFRT
jgi:hypothetical protein